jgi:hypothetical protein
MSQYLHSKMSSVYVIFTIFPSTKRYLEQVEFAVEDDIGRHVLHFQVCFLIAVTWPKFTRKPNGSTGMLYTADTVIL